MIQAATDSAFILKTRFDAGEIKDFAEALTFLDQSTLIRHLLADFHPDPINLMNRLLELAEIPFAAELPEVKAWVSQLADTSFCGEGFSFTGKTDDILSCYNAMIISVLIRMNHTGVEQINKGIGWILTYQLTGRNQENCWTGSRAMKYGGCLKSTPCYIGVVKSMIALSDYKHSGMYNYDQKLEDKLAAGLNYILDHQVYLRHSSASPITADIIKFSYPFYYKTTVVEILRLLKVNQLDKDPRCDTAWHWLESKRRKNGYWYINNTYLPKNWVHFDRPGRPGLWLTHEINKLYNL